jgi:hypothetical protein
MLEILVRRQGIVVMREILEQRLHSLDIQIGYHTLEVPVRTPAMKHPPRVRLRNRAFQSTIEWNTFQEE